MYAAKFRVVAWLFVLGVLLVAAPQGAFAQNDNFDCDYCFDLECDIDWVEVVTTAAVASTICTAPISGVTGGAICGVVIAIVTTQQRERLEDCSNQDECYDDCAEDLC